MSRQFSAAHNHYQSALDTYHWIPAARIILMTRILNLMYNRINKFVDMLIKNELSSDTYPQIASHGVLIVTHFKPYFDLAYTERVPNKVRVYYKRGYTDAVNATRKVTEGYTKEKYLVNLQLIVNDILKSYSECLDKWDEILPRYQTEYDICVASFGKLKVMHEAYLACLEVEEDKNR